MSKPIWSNALKRAYFIRSSFKSRHFSHIRSLSSSQDVEEVTMPAAKHTVRLNQTTESRAEVEGLGGLKYSEIDGEDGSFDTKSLTLKSYLKGDEYHAHTILTSGTKNNLKNRSEQRTFVDLRFIRVKSGRGGNGAVSFFRDANRPVGPPDGGDGGDGGNIYIQVVDNINSLHRVKKSYEAKSGSPGVGKQLDGKNGEDVIIEVPIGTTVRWIPDPIEIRKTLRQSDNDPDKVLLDLKTDRDEIQFFRESYGPGEGWIFKERDEEYFQERSFFTDLNESVKQHDTELIEEELYCDKFPLLGIDFNKPTVKPFLLLKGGRGGMGNMHFLTKDIRNPRFSKRGREGLTEFFLLELKLIADLGLVGMPNAGKSTLLRAISKARPRVGHWEFTTLQPSVGTIFTTIDEDPFTVADIPGIIEGASDDKGMGLDFLRHIERSGGLVFVVSLQSVDPTADLNVLVREVGHKRMRNKKILVVATKADLSEGGDAYNALRSYSEHRNWKILPVCAPKGHNIDACIRLMSETARA